MDVPEIGAAKTYEQWQRHEVTILDVREQSEWDLGHIDGATLIPLGQLQWRNSELDPALKWVCVCHIGARSYYAAAFLRQIGYDASSMEGGMVAWEEHGLPVTSPGKAEAP